MPKKTQTILFIEDEPALQKALGRSLEEEGFAVQAAIDGETGLAFVKKEVPDLILLDLILPKKDGFEVLRELKGDPATKHIPIIILTNREESADVEKALSLGASTYLVKANYQLKDVMAKIKEMLK